MKILLIGGKRFVGYHIANAALRNGHEVVFFNRGRTNSDLFPNCENIIGDRNKDLHLLDGKTFDVVIDTCAYFPHQVKDSISVLKSNIKKYLLISTLSVVKPETMNFDESVELFHTDYDSEKITAETYGPLKVACEETLVSMMGKENSIIIRPGYILGDHDYTDRFTFFPVMMKHLEEMVIPNTTDLGFTYVDGKDLGDFVIHSLEENLSGIYHTVGPQEELTYKEFMYFCRDIMNPDCQLIEKDHAFFEKEEITIPIAYPTCNDNEMGRVIYSANTQKAHNAGFRTRPLKDTILDAYNYFMSVKNHPSELAAGIKYEDLKELTVKAKN